MKKTFLFIFLCSLSISSWGAEKNPIPQVLDRELFKAKQEKTLIKKEAYSRFINETEKYAQIRVGEYTTDSSSEKNLNKNFQEQDFVWQAVYIQVPQQAYEVCWNALDRMGKLNFSTNEKNTNGKIKISHNFDTHTYRWKETLYQLEGLDFHLFSIKAPLNGRVLKQSYTDRDWADAFHLSFCVDVQGQARGEMFKALGPLAQPVLILEEEPIGNSLRKIEKFTKEVSFEWPF